MRRSLVMILLVVLALSTLSSALVTEPVAAFGGAGDVAVAAAVDGDDDNWSFWDWCVLLWTTHLDDWPD